MKSQNLIVVKGTGGSIFSMFIAHMCNWQPNFFSPHFSFLSRHSNIFSLEVYPIQVFVLWHISMVKLLKKWSENFKINMFRLRIMLAETSCTPTRSRYRHKYENETRKMFKVKTHTRTENDKKREKKWDEDKTIRIRSLNKKLKFSLYCRNGNHLAQHLDHYPKQKLSGLYLHALRNTQERERAKFMVRNYIIIYMNSHKVKYIHILSLFLLELLK